jgi:hypothetical protein
MPFHVAPCCPRRRRSSPPGHHASAASVQVTRVAGAAETAFRAGLVTKWSPVLLPQEQVHALRHEYGVRSAQVLELPVSGLVPQASPFDHVLDVLLI